MAEAGPQPDPAGVPGTKELLRLAALAAITEEGWQAAGARSVTRRAQVPLGAINYHFEGKEDLFRRAALAEVALMFRTPTHVLTDSGSIAELVESMLSWSRADDVTDLQRTLLLEVMTQSRRDPQLARSLAQALAGYRSNVVEALVRLQSDRADQSVTDRAAVAAAFAAHCDGLWLHSVIEPAFPHRDAGDAAAAIWTAALK